MLRDYIERLEGDDFIMAQTSAWITIRRWQEEVIEPLLAEIGGSETSGSVNGPGSSLSRTESIRAGLVDLLQRYAVKTVLDVPCGDWNWMRHVDLRGIHYQGWDVDPEQIERNTEKFSEMAGDPEFHRVNILTVPDLPTVDLILCRDFLAHLPTENISAVIDKFKASGTTYLLASNYPGADNAFDYKPEEYGWLGYCERLYDLEAEPFGLEKIEALAEDGSPGGVNSNPHELALFAL